MSPNVVMDPTGRPFQIDEGRHLRLLTDAGFVDARSELVRASLRMSASRLRALYASLAVVLNRPADEQPAILDKLENLVLDEHGGIVERPFLTAMYYARKPGTPAGDRDGHGSGANGRH